MKNFKNFSKKHIVSKRLDFLDFLRDFAGYSDLTIKSYDETLKEAFALIEFEFQETKAIFHLMPYRIHIASQHPKTIARKLSAIRTFANYLNEHAIPVVLKGDDSIKVPKTLPKPIATEHILQALKKAQPTERFIVVMIYTLGLRISELSNIQLHDITDQWIRIRGKGNKEREVPLLETTRTLLEEYLEQNRPKIYLFEKNGEKLSQNSLRYLINKCFKRVGLKVTPHQLRHSFATSLLNNGAAIADVSELLGHASMATTQIYTKLGSALKKENYIKTHPLCSGEI